MKTPEEVIKSFPALKELCKNGDATNSGLVIELSIIQAIEEYAEQRLLSSEAEKGEKHMENLLEAAYKYGYHDRDKDIGYGSNIPYLKEVHLKGIPPLTTKGEQNAAKKEEGELFTDEDLAVEVVARFTDNYGRNGQWSQRIKQNFIDGAMWAKSKQK